MKKIPINVLMACALCATCLVIGGVLRLAAPELGFVSQLVVWCGIGALAIETFGWGAREGCVIRGQSRTVQIERVLRCAAMSVLLVILSAFVAGPILQSVFELFFR